MIPHHAQRLGQDLHAFLRGRGASFPPILAAGADKVPTSNWEQTLLDVICFVLCKINDGKTILWNSLAFDYPTCTEVDESTPLVDLIANMPPTGSFWDEADLKQCLSYVSNSKFLKMPDCLKKVVI